MCQLRHPAASLHRCRAFVIALALLAGCASDVESGSPGEAADANTTIAPPIAAGTSAEDAGRDHVDELSCIEVVTHAHQDKVEYRRLTWYADRRTLKEESANDAAFQTASGAKLKLFATDGRVLRSIGLGSESLQRTQEDFFYDASDNRIDYHFSYPNSPSLDVLSDDEPWIAIRNSNQYDPQGRLTATTTEAYGPASSTMKSYRRTFTEDDAGRCSSSEAPGAWNSVRRETLRYDDRSRLSEYEVESGDYMCEHKLARYEYDDQSRVLAIHSDCNGSPGRSERHTHNADGSETVELMDALNDTRSYRTQRSPDCVLIDRAIGEPKTQRCRVSDP